MGTLYLTMYGDRDFRLLLSRVGGEAYEIGIVRQDRTGTPVIHFAIVPVCQQNLLARMEIARLEGKPTSTRVETVAHIIRNAMTSVVNDRQLGDPIPMMVQKTIPVSVIAISSAFVTNNLPKDRSSEERYQWIPFLHGFARIRRSVLDCTCALRRSGFHSAEV